MTDAKLNDAAPRVSVVIPTYNRETYIAEAIDSVLAQTLTDLEIIVVDDCSTDRTLELLATYGERVRVIALDPNRGPSAVRNAGIAAARGELIALLDSDDVWSPDKLERQVRMLDEDPSLDCVTGVLECIDEAGKPLARTNPGRFVERVLVDLPRVIARRMGAPSTLLMRRETATRVGPFDESLRYCEDIDHALRLATRARWLDDPGLVGLYRVHAGNISTWCEGLARGNVRVYSRWARLPLPPASRRILRVHLALSRYQLAALQLKLVAHDRYEVARLYAAAAIGDPWVDARIDGRPTTLPARAWQLAKPWLAAGASVLGIAGPLRRSIRGAGGGR